MRIFRLPLMVRKTTSMRFGNGTLAHNRHQITSPSLKENALPNAITLLISAVAGILVAGCAVAPRSHNHWLEAIPPADRARLTALRSEVKNDPEVRAARERRAQANEQYQQALRTAILKRDPSLAPILEKMRKRRQQRERSRKD